MADNTRLNPGEFGDLIATDELSTLNGGAATAGLKVQRVKIGYGADNDFNDASVATPLPVQQAGAFSATTGTLTAAAQAVTVTSLSNANGVLVTTAGTFAGTLAFEVSINGTDWYAQALTRTSGTTSESTRALTGTTLEGWRGSLVGWSQFRVRCSAYTSGTANITIVPTAVPVDATISAGAAQLGTWAVTARGCIFYNDSTTNLAASTTFTGTARDAGVTAGSVHSYSYFNAMAFSAQAGTVRIEMSNDNTTWRAATLDTAVAANTPVSIKVPVCTRYYRVVYVNGGTLQTVFMLNSSLTSA